MTSETYIVMRDCAILLAHDLVSVRRSAKNRLFHANAVAPSLKDAPQSVM